MEVCACVRARARACVCVCGTVPLIKKKDRKICDNYRGISLLSVLGKVLALVLLQRLQTIIGPKL